MQITVFTSNQPRHAALIEALAGVAERVYAVQECNTVFPGRVADFFRKSEVMQRYFARVIAAEEEVFGRVEFAAVRRNPSRAVLSPVPAWGHADSDKRQPGAAVPHFPQERPAPHFPSVQQLPIRMGDLNLLDLDALGPALESDLFVVFGASFIRGNLCDFLVRRRAVNIHMGVSPQYRGSSCNFWALYDNRPDLVGATIHLLTTGLDSGPILLHALPEPQAVDGFLLGMKAVKAAHDALVTSIADGTLLEFEPRVQNRELQIRYTRNADFTDAVAADYLERDLPPAEILARLRGRDDSQFLLGRQRSSPATMPASTGRETPAMRHSATWAVRR